jgi:hypothetical protein
MQIMSDAALSVGANATSANIYAGKLGEFPGVATIRVRISAAAVGLQATLLHQNGVNVVNDQPVSNSNRWPILPDDMLIQFRTAGGRMVLTVRNTTGAPVTFNHVTEVID